MPQSEQSWFGPSALEPAPQPVAQTQEFARLWQAFMTARLALGVLLLLLQAGLYWGAPGQSLWLIGLCTVYFLGTIAARLLVRPRYLGQGFNRAWIVLVGMDVAVFSVLQLWQGNALNYTPLFALPILLASVLGSLRLALGTAAGVTMLLLGITYWQHNDSVSEAAQAFVQAALSGAGYFFIALLAHQLAARLASEGQRARRSQLAANIERQVNALVIESLPDGVLIVDANGRVRAANPAARALLGRDRDSLQHGTWDLKSEPAWQGLLQMTRLTVGSGRDQRTDVVIQHAQEAPRRLLVRTSLAAPQEFRDESLCVVFLQDQREQEAKLRTEKLASMGRMSTAVAHEIRNPLAAIAQANALLDEDLTDPRQKQLTSMVAQNAKRLEKIVDDILNVSRVRGSDPALLTPLISLQETVHRIANDWAQQTGRSPQLQLQDAGAAWLVRFDPDHLRQVMVNLLDNAKRYATDRVASIQVIVQAERANTQQVTVSIWSNGPPMEASVERHLFEPFFTSESRSSGLGLYISRELCERHGATLTYQRSPRQCDGTSTDGNAFTLHIPLLTASACGDHNDAPWQTSLY
ncbi:MAG: ATP-binding protein [Rhodoferax sp.]|nr:ATP-binding protein [Rhodoferax sp.]